MIMANLLVFRQLFESVSCTYTYILGCAVTRKAVIIDSVLETVERDAKLLRELELEPIFSLDTHIHADHVTGAGTLKQIFPKMKSVLSTTSGGMADLFLGDYDVLKFGNEQLEARLTPGHTDGCATFVTHNHKKAFTGDALFIRGCGRTDFQEGNARTLYKSVHEKIFSLSDDFALYPGHDYKGMLHTTVAEEKKYNPRLTKSMEDFVKLMNSLKLSPPKQIEKAVPANKVGGVFELMDEATKKKVKAV